MQFLHVLHVCACICISLCVFVCTQMHRCTVVFELWYLNVCVRGLQAMRAHIFLNFIFLVKREKDELYILSVESVTSINKHINPLKVVYHPVSCFLHHYIWEGKSLLWNEKPKETATKNFPHALQIFSAKGGWWCSKISQGIFFY